ncbi:hypothetical protein [Pseudomonas sp. PDM13]|uniref:hypothetical protein n=1 Tax=Pseudomonas sp. PDM13 TaxID=2769255 RepID=UPI0021E0D221|nr:hypothetical protein [Pseudomonas sp. PDM13]MCU9949877.1 hypothetical protein [Pseudomonas sp. PDM13]
MSTYLYAIAAAYVVSPVIAFILMSSTMKEEANNLLARGCTAEDVDDYYRMMGRPTLVALMLSCVIGGTALSGLLCLIIWLATR